MSGTITVGGNPISDTTRTEIVEALGLSDASAAADRAEAAATVASAARDEALAYGAAQIYATWAELNAVTGTAGDTAMVVSSDTGTHTDPVVGGTVANAGVFQYSASPAGWERIGDLESTAAAASAAAAQAAAGVFTYEIGGFIKKAEGVDEGRYFAAVNLPFDVALSSFSGRVLTGGGTALVSLVEGDAVVIPATLANSTGFTDASSVTLSAGSDILVGVEGITGSVTEIYIRAVGLPA